MSNSEMPSITSISQKIETPSAFHSLKDFARDEESVEIVDLYDKKPSKFRKMYLAALSSLLMATSMGIATGYSAAATYDMTTRASSIVKPSEEDVSWIGSCLALGSMIGGFFAGYLSDKIGRKDTLIFNIIPLATGWLLIYFAKHIAMILIGRFICGIACAVISVTVPMYCVEISTPDVRGLLGSAFQGFLVIGTLLCIILGFYLEWESLAFVGACFATIGLICFIRMPESPRWYVAKNRMEDAMRTVRYLQGSHVDATQECYIMLKDLQDQSRGKISLKEFKHPSVYKPAFLSVALMFFQQFSGANAVFFYSSSIFTVAKKFMDPKMSSIILAAVQVVATLLSNKIVDKAGRKVLLMLSSGLMSLSSTAFGIFYYISITNSALTSEFIWVPLLSLVLFVIAFSLGFGPIPWLLVPEIVPVRFRSLISGLATFANGLFAFIVTKTFTEIENIIGKHGTFWSFSLISLIGLFFVAYMVPETKGKRLEDISKTFDR